jgi:hypothetical protein
MKFNDFIVSEEKVRLDPKCWTGKKIGNPKTKVKGGVRVNNCVPAESVEEAANPAQQAAIAIAKKKKAGVDEAAPPGAKAERMVKHIKKGYAKDGKLSDKEKSIAYATAWKAHNKGVTEGTQRVDSLVTDALKIMQGSEASDAVAALKTVLGDREYNSRRGFYNFYVRQLMDMSGQQGVAEAIPDVDHMPGPTIKRTQTGCKRCHGKGYVYKTPDGETHPMNRPDAKKYKCGKCAGIGFVKVSDQGVAEGFPKDPNAPKLVRDRKTGKQYDPNKEFEKKMNSPEVKAQMKRMAQKEGVAEGEYDSRKPFGVRYKVFAGREGRVTTKEYWTTSSEKLEKAVAKIEALGNFYEIDGYSYPKEQQGVAEEYNPEYDDEAGMVENNLETLDRTVQGLDDLINSGDNLPEWCQEKIAVAKSMLVSVWDYMYSEEASDEVDPEVDEMFEAMDQLAEEMAIKNRVSKDLVWEQFEAMPDNMLYETAAWRRKEGKSKKGGLNAKGVASYRRENPGSKLQTAVTTKPSKLKPGSKAAKRRKSFCARMGGVKGPMKKPNGKPTRKALALRKWNC